VFGTDVMVTVAKSFDAPIKLLFPKDIFASTYSYSMLGLGDIVLPGVLLALMLRYDSFRAGGKKDGFKKSYFIATFIGYVIGLALTIYIMHTFKAAQVRCSSCNIVSLCILFN
jgi:minor histocompatibility antigen H13